MKTETMNIENFTLAKEINKIVENKYPVSKGSVGGFSIEVEDGEATSYIYKTKESRDNDFNIIEELTK